MKRIIGISAGFHDAGVAVINDGEILFAAHSERYSKQKHDADVNDQILCEALGYGQPDCLAYYERPWLKKLRQIYGGQYDLAFDTSTLTVKRYLQKHTAIKSLGNVKTKTYNHHLSHAAAGFQTSPFDRATVVVIDAIGEWDTISIWAAEYDRKGRAQYRKLWSQRYPHSIGMFYSAMTKHVGLKPMDEEYIMMGMAAYGKVHWDNLMKARYVANESTAEFKENLHIGVNSTEWTSTENFDIAAGAQSLTENLIYNIMRKARDFGFSTNLVYMGGVALNCLANRNLGAYFENIWIMPNPGDAGSSLGAAALAFGGRIHWTNAFLGHDIPGDYPSTSALDILASQGIVGIASGRAEFGPRALGNRSLLADPRGPDIKDRVNEIKRRQKFRPFAPVILEEQAQEYFHMPPGFSNSRYMQATAYCRHPEQFPAIIHHDGSSRVQTVPADGTGIRELLEKWFVLTGCPMLLNTSLNIRGEPMVNDRADADRFERLYGIRVLS
jgi:carbamoyltransferase